MSADNWHRIQETPDGKFKLYYGSGEYERLEATHDTLKEAVIDSNKQGPTEYGLSIDFHPNPPTNNSKD